MRIARDAGDVSRLFPPEIENLADLPYNIHDAIRMGLAFLSYEELPKDEQPPRRIWLDADRMKAWWDEVERKREDKYGGGREKSTSNMSRNAIMDEIGL